MWTGGAVRVVGCPPLFARIEEAVASGGSMFSGDTDVLYGADRRVRVV